MDSQSRVVGYLADPRHYDGVTAVDHIETHSARVFLAGDRAYKLKRAVKYDYLDFSTAALRQAACEAEVQLNRRTAPDLYLGVAAVTEADDGTLAIDGSGGPIDWLVVMRRFDQDALLDRLAGLGALPLALMGSLAESVAALHRDAVARRDHGGTAGMAWVIDGNATDFASRPAEYSADLATRVIEGARRALARHAPRLESRRLQGRVRQCHGDLHLRNIVLLDGHPVLFDAIEFNDRIACVDVLYDVAFLVMDLMHRGLDGHATALLNHYLAASDERGGLELLPLFLSCRAAVRAKTSAASARLQSDPHEAAALARLSHAYLEDAARFLVPPPPRLVAIGGLSGTGKSTLAGRLAPGLGAAPGALVLRSDVIRKRLLGVPLGTRLGPEGYGDAVSERVYAALAERAETTLRAGHAVIADAVFANPDARERIERAAGAAGAPFTGVWLEAPVGTLRARLEARVGDVSDATPDILERQRQQWLGSLAWRRLDADGDPAATERHARHALAAGP